MAQDLVLAVVGPGRVGQALARRLVEAGVPFLGFLGRKDNRGAAAAAAVEFVGAGAVLEDARDLCRATAVLLAVQDDQLQGLVEDLAQRLEAPSGVWFHASGSQGLELLLPLTQGASGVSLGSMHPLCPFPDAKSGYRGLPDKPAVLQGDEQSLPVLSKLARLAGLRPLVMAAGDRRLYHAACALAANGSTALHAMLLDLFAAAMPGTDVRSLPQALLAGALEACREQGPILALSGPVLRGDSEVLRGHLAALEQESAETSALYRLLMARALLMAEQRGTLEPHQVTEIQELLAGDG